ncbi:MAG: rRNA maturation RNase YbeY [Bryobacterales bacterium]|nr:rRNA maturation RNase YbeY [Bryobacteraceae bacterium]MDW8129106.1 rRNA maturation RNase YbeY [Bryobacterales bacterium]
MSDPDSTVVFRRAPRGLDRERVERIAERLRREVARGRPFLCLVTGDAELRRLNRRFLGKDRATDVLSFPAPPGWPGGEPGRPPLGEIAISVDRAARQARRYGHSLEEEIGILMLHGLLHLRGMDHTCDGGLMARAEARWRKRLGLPASLTERSGG